MANFGAPPTSGAPCRPNGLPPPPPVSMLQPNGTQSLSRCGFRPPVTSHYAKMQTIAQPNDPDAFCMLPPKAVVLYDFQPQSQQEVAVLLGDIVDCLAVDPERKWLYVRTLRNTYGYVPSAYCRFMAVVAPQPPPLLPPPPAPVNEPMQQPKIDRNVGVDYCLPNQVSDYVSASAFQRLAPPTPGPTRPVTRNILVPTSTIHRPQGPVPHPAEFPPAASMNGPADRTMVTLSPCSIASASSSGVSTCYSNGSDGMPTDPKLMIPLGIDDCSFSRSAFSQCGSASGSSIGSACERRIKMVRTNEQKVAVSSQLTPVKAQNPPSHFMVQKLLRAKSADTMDGSSKTQSLNQAGVNTEKMVDALWSASAKHKPLMAFGVRRPAAMLNQRLKSNPAVKNTTATDDRQRNDANNRPPNANVPEVVLCETFV